MSSLISTRSLYLLGGSCLLPVVSSYQLYYNPQRVDVLTEDFIQQYNKQQATNEEHIKSIHHFDRNEINRSRYGSTGDANVSFVAHCSNSNIVKAQFDAKLTHFIWMYGNVNPNQNMEFKPYDDYFHSSVGYHAHQICCSLPIVFGLWLSRKLIFRR